MTFNIDDINGVIPALVTPFNRDESLSEVGMRVLVEHLIKKGVNGLYLTGSTGEGFLMTPSERERVVEVVIDQVQQRIPVIVHVGAIGTKISIDLTQHAEKAGADAVSSVPLFIGNLIVLVYTTILRILLNQLLYR
jgi:N-acetylneuraminate lyase